MKYIIRLFRLAKPWAKYLIIATVALFVVSGINLLTPYIIKLVIAIMETGDFEGSLDKIITFALILLFCLVLRAICQFFYSYYAHVASWRLVNRMRCMIYDHLQKLSMSYYQDKQTGQLMSRVVNDTTTIESLISHSLPDIATNIIMLIGVLTILLLTNPLLTLLVCIPLPFIVLTSFTLRKMRQNFRKGQAKIAELNAVLQDNFSGIKEIQVFNKQKNESERVREKSADYSNALIKALFYSGILNPAVGFISATGTVIVLIAGPIIALKSNLSVSDIVAFLLYLTLFYAPVASLTRVVEDLQQALAGAERAFEVLDTEPDIKDSPNAIAVGRLSGHLEFKNVSFSYQDGITVLDDISFAVKPGQMVAIVGPTGVGKSTISMLFARFYDPTAGTVMMDGIDIREMTLESLRNQLSLVLQDVFLFNGTIAENISYGCGSASKEDIEKSAKTACIDAYINSLPDKYDTVIGERGLKLSGGQKQRISIARSILRNAPILILDEATSSVDTETEREIQNAINKIAGSRTLIVIAHRLSTVRKADVIIALQDGKIAESGSHDELIKGNGIYANLWRIQNSN